MDFLWSVRNKEQQHGPPSQPFQQPRGFLSSVHVPCDVCLLTEAPDALHENNEGKEVLVAALDPGSNEAARALRHAPAPLVCHSFVLLPHSTVLTQAADAASQAAPVPSAQNQDAPSPFDTQKDRHKDKDKDKDKKSTGRSARRSFRRSLSFIVRGRHSHSEPAPSGSDISTLHQNAKEIDNTRLPQQQQQQQAQEE